MDEEMLLGLTEKMNGVLVDPLKTTIVQDFRCMTTWVLRKRRNISTGRSPRSRLIRPKRRSPCAVFNNMRPIVLPLFLAATPVFATQPSLPSTFTAQTIHSPAGADIFVRSGGRGPVVVLIHGYGETSDSWGPLAAELAKTYTVVVPDLRGIGHSSQPAGGYDKKTQAADIRSVVTTLGYDRTYVVSHDIGIMVAYAYAALYPDKVERLVVMDAPIPGIAPWDEIVKNPKLWHFSFWGPDEERLVQGRERIYLDRIWNDFSGNPKPA